MKIPKLDWPDDILSVECVNFSQPLIYDLMVGVNHERVEFVSSRVNSWYHTYVFDYLGFRYELEVEEFGELRTPYRLSKIARIDVDDEGEPVVVSLTAPPKAVPSPSYEGVWGSF